MYNYILSIHIIFVVCWFAGLFYMVRLFIYHTEAQEKPEPDHKVLSDQF
ncbi:MAG TPA: CopD family protein, partial [Mucilaginibacter sp.]